ncbi:hypothetical protein L208DRAFT_1292492, partial [Tricholoma matsutake]
FGAAEIDAHYQHLAPNHNIHLFMKGISLLSCVTGQEHDEMAHILLSLIVDIPLPGGLSPVCLVQAVRALLDFLYLAQYSVHTDETLELLDDALDCFHANREIFVELGVHNDFNFPKLHFACHYAELIKLFGTTDNFNTEHTECLHIDLAKDAYCANNHKDEFMQMTRWLEHKEKVFRHEQYILWWLYGCPDPEKKEWLPPGLQLD